MPGIGISSPKQAKKVHSRSGSGLGDIWHVMSGTGRGIYHGVTGLPTGAYMLGRAALHDTKNIVTGKDFSNHPNLQTAKLAKAIAKQEYASYRHFGKGGDISGPLFDASALLTGGATTSARLGKSFSEVSKASKALRAAHAAELHTKDAAVMQAIGGGGIKGAGWDRAAKIYKIPASELKKHYRRNREFLQEGNFSVGKPAGVQGKYANITPDEALKQATHPLFEHYARRYPTLISEATRARKAFTTKPLYSRPLLKGKIGSKSKSGFYVPTSPNPAFRTIRKGREQLRTERSANRDLLKESVRREITQERFGAPKVIRPGVKKAPERQGALQTAITLPMSALRTAMWARPRYYLQNIGQTGQMIGTAPALTGKSGKIASDLFIHHRDLYNTLRAVTGETQAGALAAGVPPTRLGSIVGKKIGGRVGKQIEERGIQGAMGYAANIPESHVRMLSVLNELQKHHAAQGNLGALTPAQIEKYFGNIRRSGVISPEHLPLRRAVEEVGDFGRIYSKNMLKQRRPSEREFMATQLPIFYPMFKALSRYGIRFPSEHAVMAAEGLALGKQGKKEQHRLLGDLPFWAQYLVPKAAGDPNAHHQSIAATRNPANLYNFQPATDIGRQLAEMARKGGPNPGISMLQESGPAPGIAYGLMTGKDIQTGYPIKPFSKSFYKHHPNLNRSLINVPYNYASSLPLSDLANLVSGQPSHVRSYQKGSTKDRILNELIGPAFIPRNLKTKETKKQAKREKHYGQGRVKKKSIYNP